MRLSSEYIKVFISAINKFLPPGAQAELRLYGSRVDDSLKGGDIDLLIITHNKEIADQLKQCKPQILGNIFIYIDEQKIDLLISESTSVDPFVNKALQESILIHQFC